MKRQLAILLMLAMWPCTGLQAQQITSTSLRVSVRVQDACEVIATNLDFGDGNMQRAGPLLGTSLMRVNCSPNTSYAIGLHEGAFSGAVAQRRKMMPSANAAPLRETGTGLGSGALTGVGTGQAVDHTLFGSVPAAQLVPGEEYSDAVVVRIYY